jgi:PIN domain nuclease of toxin-antitoxin system
MKFLLDTHILIWALAEPERLQPKVRERLEAREHQILFSSASIWEIAVKKGLKKSAFEVSSELILRESERIGFVELPVFSRATVLIEKLHHYHEDPFDRLLVAQAISESARLITADSKLALYSDLVELMERV